MMNDRRYTQLRDLAANKLARLEIANCGRWARITLKKTGEVLTLVRLGYGSMENPWTDKHHLEDSQGNVLTVGKDLWEIADYILGL